jgi:hypothetical protein
VDTEREVFVEWLLYLRIGSAGWKEAVQKRFVRYLAIDRDARGLFFSDLLVADLPEAGRAPLVLLRLFPLTVELITANAFDDVRGAAEIRRQQLELLPPITDCHDCSGRPLANGECCEECGNPVWKFPWLLAT